jgi:hypothetical protein
LQPLTNGIRKIERFEIEKLFNKIIFLLSSVGPDEAKLIRILTESSVLEHLIPNKQYGFKVYADEAQGEVEILGSYSSLAQLVRASDC